MKRGEEYYHEGLGERVEIIDVSYTEVLLKPLINSSCPLYTAEEEKFDKECVEGCFHLTKKTFLKTFKKL